MPDSRPFVEIAEIDALLWRSHRAAAALLRDLRETSQHDRNGMEHAEALLACVNRHIEPLRAAVEAVEAADEHERRVGGLGL